MAADGFDDDDIFKAIFQFFNDEAERLENDLMGFSSLLGKRKEWAENDDLGVSKSMKRSTAEADALTAVEEETEDLVSNILFGTNDSLEMGSGKSSGIISEWEGWFEFEKILQTLTDADDDDDTEFLSVDELLQSLEGQIDQ